MGASFALWLVSGCLMGIVCLHLLAILSLFSPGNETVERKEKKWEDFEVRVGMKPAEGGEGREGANKAVLVQSTLDATDRSQFIP